VNSFVELSVEVDFGILELVVVVLQRCGLFVFVVLNEVLGCLLLNMLCVYFLSIGLFVMW